MGMTIGIDLGTTNSVMCIKKASILCLRNAEGDELTPSCVAAIPDIVVGRPARDLLKQYPKQTVLSIKRLMGRDIDDNDVQQMIHQHRVNYDITTDLSEPGSIRVLLGDTSYSPEMISGMILKKLIHDGEAELQGKITQAVVTVPAYFSDRQKFATRAACDYAGIQLLRLLPEPTAAALSFGLGELSKDEASTMMVFDLGGGTFDISVLNVSGGSFMEITKGGDMWLGGDNIDQQLLDHVLSTASDQDNDIRTLVDALSPTDKARFLVELKEKAEAAKIALSTEDSASVELFGLLKDKNNKLVSIDVTITRTEFSALIQPMVDRIVAIAQQILYEIHFELTLIDTVLLVGGSSLVPAIQEAIKTLFGAEKVRIHPRPMAAIAEGAAWMAAKLAGQTATETNDFSLMHSTAHDYYLQLAGGKRHLLVARNTPLPVSVEEKLTFSHHTQKLARLRVFNEVDGLLDTVGELWFHKTTREEDPASYEEEKPTELMLRFSVNEDNIISMKAWSLEDKKQSVETQIARGGLAAKLYQDLEYTLSSAVTHSSNRTIEEDILALSQQVVQTILSASDPITGETRPDQKRIAEQQIQTLRAYQENDIAPLFDYTFLQMAYHEAKEILSSEEKARLEGFIEQLKPLNSVHLADPTAIGTLYEELKQFYDDAPVIYELADAKDAANLLTKIGHKKEAKHVQEQMKRMIRLYKNNDDDTLDETIHELHGFILNYLSYGGKATGRFDRDVTL